MDNINLISMKKFSKYLFSSLLIVLTMSMLVSPVMAETNECIVIDSLPYVITTQDVYCAKSHLSTSITSGSAITILVNNVTIDFNGFKLGGLGAGINSEAIGVFAKDRLNITIKGANIRGFLSGIAFDGGAGHVVQDSSFDGNIISAITSSSEGFIISDNRIVNTYSLYTNSYGLLLGGGNALIENNFISNTKSDYGDAFAIVAIGGNTRVVNNTIIGLDGIVESWAIFTYADPEGQSEVRDNFVTSNSLIDVGIATHDTDICRNNSVINAIDTLARNCSVINGNNGIDVQPISASSSRFPNAITPSAHKFIDIEGLFSSY